MKKLIGFVMGLFLLTVAMFGCKKSSTDSSLSYQISGEYGKVWVLTGYKSNGVDSPMTTALKNYKLTFLPSGSFINSDSYKGVWSTVVNNGVQTISVLFNPVNNNPPETIVYVIQSISTTSLVVSYTVGTQTITETLTLA